MTQLDKGEVLDGLFGCWDEIDELLSGLSDEQWVAPSDLPGWRVQDVVSHLIGVESVLMGVPAPDPDCDVSELPHVHNEVGVMNECWVRHLHAEPPGAVLDTFRSVTGERRAALLEMGDDAWNETIATPVGPDTYGRFMRVRIFDCWMHEHDIRYAVGVWATDDVLLGPASEQALSEIASTLGYIVGKLGKAPDGSRVAFELTGPLQRTMLVAVDGRARVVDEFDGDPTTTIRLDAVLFTRLAGGRTSAAENPAAIEILGDVDLGKQVLERLTFVI
ncbi:MAG: maleylpyruvate isomerase family mycothiol-dependent enzyme [Mycobacteriaceae bacterium]|nr:maleylpyruvate isomerase family mycothiol-dependent enzyme [Mycobacteriaceae bacterium]